jgi:hypothetical protein
MKVFVNYLNPRERGLYLLIHSFIHSLTSLFSKILGGTLMSKTWLSPQKSNLIGQVIFTGHDIRGSGCLESARP